MHEMSLAEGVLQIIEEQAREQAFARVSLIVLEVGQLANVEVAALRFALDAVLRDTLAEAAAVEIVDVPGQAWCLHCEDTVPVAARYEACPRCGGYQLQVTGGTDMRVRELAVD